MTIVAVSLILIFACTDKPFLVRFNALCL